MAVFLIAEQTDHTVKFLEEELAPENFELVHARDGQEVIAIIDSLQIAVAIVESELPFVNGLSVIGRLTSKEPKPKKIVATTFLEDDLICEVARHLGADAVVRNPFFTRSVRVPAHRTAAWCVV
jgi:DNA-binding response OmpR family regulator